MRTAAAARPAAAASPLAWIGEPNLINTSSFMSDRFLSMDNVRARALAVVWWHGDGMRARALTVSLISHTVVNSEAS